MARLLPLSGSRVLVQPLEGQAASLPSDTGNGISAASGGGLRSSNDSSSHRAWGGATALQALAPATHRPSWVVPAAEAAGALAPSLAPIFMGLDGDGAPHFAGVVQCGPAADALAAAHSGSEWVAARSAGPTLSPGDASLVATASGLAAWNLDARFSGSSGAPTVQQLGGHARGCSATGRQAYPRVDPAIITLVTSGDWALLGRKEGWPEGRYSTLAGFLEVGETLEQALVREVLEESAVTVDPASVRYHASQPWPFPRSLMVGFYATAAQPAIASWGSSSSTTHRTSNGTGGAMHHHSHHTHHKQQQQQPPPQGLDLLHGQARAAALDVGIRPEEVSGTLLPLLPPPSPQLDEMQDVRWFHKDWMHAALALDSARTAPTLAGAPPFAIPGPYSLANRLITGWLWPLQQQQQHMQSNGLSGAAGTWVGDQVPQVQIDACGAFKYVLMRLRDEAKGRSKLLVWGCGAAAFHNHVYQRAKAQAQALGLAVDVLGGGRIEHSREQKVLSVYGYSAAFGPAPHEVSGALLRRWYPFHDVTTSYDGY